MHLNVIKKAPWVLILHPVLSEGKFILYSMGIVVLKAVSVNGA